MIRCNRQAPPIPLTFVLPFLVLLLFSCAHYGDWARRVNWKEFEFSSLPGREDYPDAGAIVIMDEGKMEVGGGNQLPMSVFERHRIVKILNHRGHHYANISIPYTPQSQVESIRARTISPDGKITVLKKKDIFDVTLYPQFIFYSDQRAKIFTMPAVEDGAVIEYRYRLSIRGRSLWPSWNFQDLAPTLKSRFTLSSPSKLKINYKLHNIDIDPVISEAPEGFKSTYTWEAKNVAALIPEFGMPSLNDCLARLEIAPVGMENWDQVANWYRELADPQVKAGKNIKELAARLTKGIETDEAKIKAIYEWVRDQVRYVAVAIGIGGFQPHPAGEVLTNRYGDCKDMTTLLCAMLREVGIETYPVLLSTWQNGIADTSLPSPFQFNHAIAYCPSAGDSGVWLDATDKGCPSGKLPWYDQGLPVLVVGKEDEAEIITTPQEPVDSNRVSYHWKVALAETGAAAVAGKISYHGAAATEIRGMLYYLSQQQQRQWLETELALRCAGAQLDSFSVSGLNPIRDPLTIRYNFRTKTFATVTGNRMTIRPGALVGFQLPDYFRSPRRQFPIQFRFGFRTAFKLAIAMPDNWQVATANVSDSLKSEYGSAWWRSIVQADSLCHQVSFSIRTQNIPPDSYPAFQRYLDGIEAKNLRELVLVKQE